MAEITLLDGGMGQELVKRSGDTPTPLWSTQVMMDHPGLVSEIHRDYYAAGATVATMNSYALHRDRLAPAGMEDKFDDLHEAALREAKSAQAFHGKGRIAASIGPLGASYRADKHPEPMEAVPLYVEVAEKFEGQVDLVIAETVVSLDHTKAILYGAKAAHAPLWLAFSVDDEDGTKLRNGESLFEAADMAVQAGARAVLVNCSAPEAIPAALDELKRTGAPYGAYANGFTQITKAFLEDRPTVDALQARRDLTPEIYADHAMAWVDHGATIIGGCCEVGPAHITEIAKRLRAAEHTII